MNELQRLDDEFNFPNSAAAKFNITFECVRAGHVALNSSFDLCDFVEQIRRWTSRVNEGLMLTKKFISQFAIAGDSARFDQGDAFPGFAKAGIVIFHAFKRAHQRTSSTFRAQTKINSKKCAFRISNGERFQHLLSQPVEPLMIRNSR